MITKRIIPCLDVRDGRVVKGTNFEGIRDVADPVEMALDRLSENKVVELDDERKAAMVSNLLVVLCGNRDAQPIVNSGSLY